MRALNLLILSIANVAAILAIVFLPLPEPTWRGVFGLLYVAVNHATLNELGVIRDLWSGPPTPTREPARGSLVPPPVRRR